MAVETIPGDTIGSTIWKNIPNFPTPSTFAASSIPIGTV